METKRDIFTSFSVIVVVIFMAMIINITYNLRGLGISDSKEKAELIAQSVKNGLTAHMVNGIMENRDFYINQIKDLENVDDIWIVRSDTVNKQFGKSKEIPIDDIDKEVLEKGEPIQQLNESLLGHNSYRITIPYKAEITPTIDCTSCHTSEVGDVLGAVSIVLSVDNTKIISSKIIAYTSFISLILIIVIFVFVKNLITPYLSIFESIKDVMQKAHDGDYSGRIIGIDSG
ncbi:MAG: GGDEF domain-containing protein, partial [Campylobacterota bacterium]|nr:GGDEF domain-containing protein [Campylobacterota bacterium]